MTLVDFQPRLSKAKEKRILLRFSMSLDAKTVSAAPKNISEAFYAVCKDDLGLNPVGIEAEFSDVAINFYATTETVTPTLKVSGCSLKKLQVVHPDKVEVNDGDIKLTFVVHVPASEKAIIWSYRNHACDLAAEFVEIQLSIPVAKEEPAAKEGDSQMKLGETVPTDQSASNVESITSGKKAKSKKK